MYVLDYSLSYLNPVCNSSYHTHWDALERADCRANDTVSSSHVFITPRRVLLLPESMH